MNNPNYYAILTAEVRYCNELSAQEKLLFAEITALSSKEGVCFAGNKYFADLYSLTDTTISHQISHLAQLGFITVSFDKEGARVKKRYITVAKNRNGEDVLLAKKSNHTVAKNRKDNNTSILTLQDNNNISDDAKACVYYFIECQRKNNPKYDRSEKQKIEFAKTFENMFPVYPKDEVMRMIKFATTNNFWKSICLSAKKIYQHCEQLYVQMASRTNPVLDCDKVENPEVDF